jgi:hypothetical protein
MSISEQKFEEWRKEQIASLVRMGYPDAAKAFRDLGSVQWAGWQAAWNELKAENESLRADAERYRWFRDCGNDWHKVVVIDSHGRIICEEVDAAIDAAISSPENH